MKIIHVALILSIFAAFSVSAKEETDGKDTPSTFWRWLGVKAQNLAACPSAGVAWQSAPAFPTAAPGSRLASYCVFTANSGQPVAASSQDALRSLVPVKLDEVTPDLMAMGSFGTAASPELWQPLADYFLRQAGGGELPTGLGHTPVRLAVLDTHPTADVYPLYVPSNSDHGYTLLAMAQRSLCTKNVPETDCVVQLTSRLALSYTQYHPLSPDDSTRDLILGGYVGTLGELAEAIRAEVDAWKQSSLEQNLVLNLSVGWNSRFGGKEADSGEMPVPVRMVHDAILDARCNDALVVAATGNRSGGAETGDGPMMPAAWAARLMPAKCIDQRHKNLPLDPGVKPMLYAVGGVQGNGQPLANSRRWSMPERVAFGDHGVVEGHVSGVPTAILTGSSVSSLVTAAAAAASWYYDPGATAEQIMARVDAAGDVLALQPDYCFGSTECPATRRVSICASVAETCAQQPGLCSSISCEAWDPSPPVLFDTGATQDPTFELTLDAITEVYPQTDICEPSIAHFDPLVGPSVDPCPDRQYLSIEATPWVHPQPGTHACPPCRVKRGEQQLIIEIDSQLAGTLSQPTLDVCGSSYSLGNIPLEAGTTTVVNDVDTTGCDAATVSFTVTENGVSHSSIDSALIID